MVGEVTGQEMEVMLDLLRIVKVKELGVRLEDDLALPDTDIDLDPEPIGNGKGPFRLNTCIGQRDQHRVDREAPQEAGNRPRVNKEARPEEGDCPLVVLEARQEVGGQ